MNIGFLCLLIDIFQLLKDSKGEVESTPESVAAKKRDEELSTLVSNYNSAKRSSALIDMHQVNSKKVCFRRFFITNYVSGWSYLE